MAENRDFKGVWIPKEVWLDKRLTALDKVILTEIDSLDSSERGCYASNQALAEFCQCSETKVSGAISKLISLDYIYVQKFDGRTRELKSRLTKNERQTYKICEADTQKNKENNISNNTLNNTIKDIVEYLNKRAETAYRANSKTTQKHIQARLNDGFTVDDFKKVIDKKCDEWKGTEMEKYLRPETLFGTKFESYLNAKIIKDTKRAVIGEDLQRREYSDDQLNKLINVFDD